MAIPEGATGGVEEPAESSTPDRAAEARALRDRSRNRADLPAPSSTRLRFRPDEDLPLSRIDVIDRATGRVIRTIPAERPHSVVLPSVPPPGSLVSLKA